MQHFGENAAQSSQQDRTPLRIAPRAHNQFRTRRRHALHEHALEGEARLFPRKVAQHTLPCLQHLPFILKIQNHASGVGLVRQSRGLSLQCHRVTDAVCNGTGLMNITGQSALRNADSELRKNLLATVFRRHARGNLDRGLFSECTRAAAPRCTLNA